MSVWQWARVWVWLVGLGAIETAPRPQSAKTLDLGAEFLPFIDRPDFFDYADSDEARLLALAQFIGEKPVSFNSDSKSRLFYRILLGTLVVAFFFLLLQFCAHMSYQKGA